MRDYEIIIRSTYGRIEESYKDKLVNLAKQAPDVAVHLMEIARPIRKIEAVKGKRRSSHITQIHYGEVKQRIELAMTAIKRREKEEGNEGSTYYHELGHYIDCFYMNVSEGMVFQSIIKQEVDEFVKHYVSNQIIRHMFSDLKDKNIVSDLISAFYNDIFDLPYAHEKSYWEEDIYNVNKEAFAHFYSALFVPSLLPQIEKYFPQSFQEFITILYKAKKSNHHLPS